MGAEEPPAFPSREESSTKVSMTAGRDPSAPSKTPKQDDIAKSGFVIRARGFGALY